MKKVSSRAIMIGLLSGLLASAVAGAIGITPVGAGIVVWVIVAYEYGKKHHQ